MTATAGDGQVQLTWIAPAGNGAPVTGYTVTGTDGTTPLTPISLPAGSTTTTVTGLTDGTTYTFTITATNTVGTSSPTTSGPVVPVMADGATSKPPPPTGVSVVSGVGVATVTWNQPPPPPNGPIDYYVLTVLDSNNNVVQTVTVSSGANSKLITGLQSNVSYSFTVASVNSVGTSSATASGLVLVL